jgi:hypothetical protein
MLRINIYKIAEKCRVENLLKLSQLFGWIPATAYKYSNPDRVKALQLNTLSQIVQEIARQNKISPLDVKFGDIFDWQKDH